MSGRQLPAIPETTIARQRTASDPRRSAWVSANAGSGKTHVLAQRVERLLLAGTHPAKILCLTFTKAAAAEMSNRVFKELGKWAVAGDDDLEAALSKIEGRPISPEERARARRLFAEALETPGGLKIQTIHAFCDRLLHAFPFEAGVSGHFEVLDETTAAELLAEARAEVFERAVLEPDSAWGRALTRLVEASSEDGLRDALKELVAKRDALSRLAAETREAGGIAAAAAIVLGVAVDEDPDAVLDEIVDPPGFPPTYRARLVEAFAASSKKNQDAAGSLVAFAEAPSRDEQVKAWQAFLLTKEGKPRSSVVTAAMDTPFPELAEKIAAETARLLNLLDRRRAALALAATLALVSLGEAVIARYERAKARRGLLDYEDLVVRTARLLQRGDAALWVQYKLDRGIDHILVDEAQDTSPRQWEVIEALAGEFFAGETARRLTRTIFAVGDEKQSIYSFQGAIPAYFERMKRSFEARARNAEAAFEPVRLTLSFRSTSDVLDAVDTVFSEPDRYYGLSEVAEPTVHEAIRQTAAGRVEIWPPFLKAPGAEAPENWWDPVDSLGEASPERRHAAAIADRIAGWFAGPARRAIDGRALTPGDILVLVRKRGAFANEMLRALKERGLPVAGADRLVLTEHVAVADLMALADFCLLPPDDYGLAVVLKSPLFGFSDDDLVRFTAEPGRPLLAGLERAAATDTRARAALDRLAAWRRIADFVPPFEFFAEVLGPGGGRQAFEARLGAEANEALDEFLAQALDAERAGPATLQGFLARLVSAEPEIKRDMDIARDEIRVMTVHGAKGLEAPVVFLADTASVPSARHDPAVLAIERPLTPPDAAPALVFNPRKAERTAAHVAALETEHARAEEEYHRLLYVAMTRAGDELYISAHAGKTGVPEGSWYAMVRGALEPTSVEEAMPGLGEPVLVRARAATSGEAIEVAAGKVETITLPDWVARPAPGARRPSRRLSPSDIGAAPIAFAGVGGAGARRGELVHRLLESLAPIGAPDRPAMAARVLEVLGETGPDAGTIATEALAVLDAPAFAALFTATSRGEVPVDGEVEIDGRRFRVEGRIDRLVIGENDVLIVDYKTGRAVPETEATVPPAHVAQLALYRRLVAEIYPDKRIGCALLWTAGPRLMQIADDSLEAALAEIARKSPA